MCYDLLCRPDSGHYDCDGTDDDADTMIVGDNAGHKLVISEDNLKLGSIYPLRCAASSSDDFRLKGPRRVRRQIISDTRSSCTEGSINNQLRLLSAFP